MIGLNCFFFPPKLINSINYRPKRGTGFTLLYGFCAVKGIGRVNVIKDTRGKDVSEWWKKQVENRGSWINFNVVSNERKCYSKRMRNIFGHVPRIGVEWS